MDAPTLPPGHEAPDFADAHFRYLWRAQYDSLTDGPWLHQLDEHGMSRSVGVLDFKRIVRLELVPQWPGLPILELRVKPGEGETAIKFWQTDVLCVPGNPTETREVLGIQKHIDGRSVKFFVLHQAVDNRLIIGTSQNV